MIDIIIACAGRPARTLAANSNIIVHSYDPEISIVLIGGSGEDQPGEAWHHEVPAHGMRTDAERVEQKWDPSVDLGVCRLVSARTGELVGDCLIRRVIERHPAAG